jgi:aspartate racemase
MRNCAIAPDILGDTRVKVIGIVGGIGPESTVDYYRMLLARFRERGSAKTPGILINSIDVIQLLALANSGDRAGLTEYLLRAIEALARAGADLGLFAANTPHLVFDEVQRRAPIRLVSIVAATCDAAHSSGMTRVGLLGTRFTMQGHFYPEVFAARRIAVVVPEAADQTYVHEKYVNELVAGKFLAETRAGFLAVIDRMRARDGIDGVILGGTELPLLLRESTHALPFLDTGRIHVDAVVGCVLSERAG